MPSIVESEALIRLSVFAGVLSLMVLLETVRPRRVRRARRSKRWPTNAAITALGAAAVRVMALAAVPLTATAAALWATEREVGLLHLLELPVAVEIALALVVLDLAIWAQHLVSHHVGFLWRIHRVHHVDRDIDATTALRFHPIEIGLSMLFKAVVVVAVGPTVLAVILFEIGLNGFAIFNHANARLPRKLDQFLRLFLVTPDVHRVHHSIRKSEHNSNFGFSTTLWDRIFRTYVSQPDGGHEAMTIGLEGYQTAMPSKLGWSLRLPLAAASPPCAETPTAVPRE